MPRTILSATVSALMASSALAGVTTEALTFENDGAEMQGTLYLPKGHESGSLPTVIVTGAWTTVEEQMPSIYARAMAERGFAAVTFDFRGWGKSSDLPQGVRFKEDPTAKIADIQSVIAQVAEMDVVDAARIHGLGICASAGYMVDATAGNDLIASVGLVAPWLQNAEIVDAVYGGPEGVAALIEVSRSAEDTPTIIPAAGPEGTEGVLMPLDGYYVDPARGAIPAYDNRWNQASWEGWLTYHPADSAPGFDKPLAVVHSEAAAIPQGLRAFLAALPRRAAETWLDGVDQFAFYDDPAHVGRAADAIAGHFAEPATAPAN